MLDWIQQQAIADALYGLEPTVDVNAFDEPWRTIYHNLPAELEGDDPRHFEHALWDATAGLGTRGGRRAIS